MLGNSEIGYLLTALLNRSICRSRLRSLIIKLERPIFVSIESYSLPTGVQKILSSSNLNEGQRTAIEQALRAQDYSLIEGLPGTGK